MKTLIEHVTAVNIDMARRIQPDNGTWLLPVTLVGDRGATMNHRLRLLCPAAMNPVHAEFWELAKKACIAFRRDPHYLWRRDAGLVLLREETN